VIAYDITSGMRCNKLEKVVRDYGEKVNISVFECDIEKTFSWTELKYKEHY
jgi:CRISPR/Cas system-associated endoribonuclease Cas2